MNRILRVVGFLFILALPILLTTLSHAQTGPQDRDEQEKILVGRISHIEGQLLRYVPDEKDWITTVGDTPFGINDTLYSDKGGRVEIIMPNNTWARMDSDTQIQLIRLKEDLTDIEINSGVVRFYNKGSNALIKATTPFGYVTGPAETTFDIYLDDDSLEVIALKGKVYFVHDTTKTRFEVIADSASIVADTRQVTAGEGLQEPEWLAWNTNRDELWANRMKLKGKSAKYLPSRLYDHAYVLEENGRWERIYYDGAYYYFWRPVYVSVGWTPFTVGRWALWYGENTWIPYEPFGYVTHHYGNWVFVRGFWYWAPPVDHLRVHIGSPTLNIGFAWYPGRVAWINLGVNVGWFPLAPHESYYCYRRWGPRSTVVNDFNIANINLNLHRYRHYKYAVIINRNHFYRARNYRNVRIRHINSASIIRNYQVTPFVSNLVIKNKNLKERNNFSNIKVTRRPDQSIIKRIPQNRLVARHGPNAAAKTIQQNVTNNRLGRIEKRTWITPQRNKDREVSVHQPSRAVLIGKVEERENKKKTKLRTEGQMQPKREALKQWKKVQRNSIQTKVVGKENQTPVRSELKKRLKKSSLESVKKQVMRSKDQNRAMRQPNERRSRSLSGDKQQVQDIQERIKTTQIRQPQLRESVRQEQHGRRERIEKYRVEESATQQKVARPIKGVGALKGWSQRRLVSK